MEGVWKSCECKRFYDEFTREPPNLTIAYFAFDKQATPWYSAGAFQYFENDAVGGSKSSGDSASILIEDKHSREQQNTSGHTNIVCA